jgi:hypothetical protein
MTEKATRKPWLTRRRVIVAAVLLVLVCAAAVFLFPAIDAPPAKPVKLTFLRFDIGLGGASTTAVIRVQNVCNRRLQFMSQDGNKTITGVLVTSNHMSWNFMGLPYELKPNCVVTSSIELPMNDGIGQIFIPSSVVPRKVPRILSFASKFWDRLQPRVDWLDYDIWDYEFECPHRLADGTVAPARLLPRSRKTP